MILLIITSIVFMIALTITLNSITEIYARIVYKTFHDMNDKYFWLFATVPWGIFYFLINI